LARKLKICSKVRIFSKDLDVVKHVVHVLHPLL
jgi:hypothetical protein